MALTTSIPVLTQYVVDKLETAAPSFTTPLASVHYGDQDKIASTPVVCVEPSDLSRVLDGVPRKTAVTIDLYIIVYLAKLQSPELNRIEADSLVEDVQTLLHADRSLGGQVIHSMVTRIESGFSNKGNNTILRASRLTFSLTSRELLPTT